MQLFFAHNWKRPAHNSVSLIAIVLGSFDTYNWTFSAHNWNLFTYSLSLFVYNGKVHLCSYYCHRNHYQINGLGIIPGHVPVKNYRINYWGIFTPVVHCRILFTEYRSECHRIGERQGVFGNGPKK